MPDPMRGEVWQVDLSPTRGHEQAGERPCLVVSVDKLNAGPAGLVIALPFTRACKGIPSHVKVSPPEGGLTDISYAKCEDVRSLDKGRLIMKRGAVSQDTLRQVEKWLRLLMGL